MMAPQDTEGARGEAAELNPGDEAKPMTVVGSGEALCPACHGTGKLAGGECVTCRGTGPINEDVGGG
jgi:RecJ-like exonuclease